MNHDATHCADYKKCKCPKNCYRAQLTEELRNIYYPLPTSWAYLKGTKECPLTNDVPDKQKVIKNYKKVVDK